jgi:hypothetical protein
MQVRILADESYAPEQHQCIHCEVVLSPGTSNRHCLPSPVVADPMFLDRFHTYGKDDVHLLTCNSIPKSAMLQVTAPATFVTEQLRIACTQLFLQIQQA